MTNEQAAERIRTITGLAGVSCEPVKVLAQMIADGTWSETSERIDLGALWRAVGAIEDASRRPTITVIVPGIDAKMFPAGARYDTFVVKSLSELYPSFDVSCSIGWCTSVRVDVAGADLNNIECADEEEILGLVEAELWDRFCASDFAAAVSEDQIRALRGEAAVAGDASQVDLCERALAGDAAARIECAAAIEAARARAGA